MIPPGPCVLSLPLVPGPLLLAQRSWLSRPEACVCWGRTGRCPPSSLAFPGQECSAHRRCLPGAPFPQLRGALPVLPSVLVATLATAGGRGRPQGRAYPREKENPLLELGFSHRVPGSMRVPLPGPFRGHVLFCHWPLTSFTTRQFSDPVTLFVTLYFTAAASGKWVLYLGTSCLNTRPPLTRPQSHVS